MLTTLITAARQLLRSSGALSIQMPESRGFARSLAPPVATSLPEFLVICGVALTWLSAGNCLAQNLLINGDFEMVPNPPQCAPNEPLSCMPSSWYAVSITPDTYSVDGSYGIEPGFGGNFPGVHAQSGMRFVAAWAFRLGCGGPLPQVGCGAQPAGLYAETFAQTLTTPLHPGCSYELSASLLLGPRSCQSRPGTYDVYLTGLPATAGTDCTLLGSLTPVSSINLWQGSSFQFVAPPGSDAPRAILFVPRHTGEVAESYVAIDSVVLRSACPADFNCDGEVDFFDYLDFVDAFSSQLPAADFNGDSVIDFFDYLDFVDAFSVGC